MKKQHLIYSVLLALCTSLPGCSDSSDTTSDPADDTQDNGALPASGNRMTVPKSVRENLGITFAKVESRVVAKTLRVPGQFELLPTASRDYHSPVTGRISLAVAQFDLVQRGEVIATIDSPDWRDLQAELIGAQAAVRSAQSQVAVSEATMAEQVQRIELLSQRIDRLSQAQVRRVELEYELAQAHLVLPRLEAEHEARRTEYQNTQAQVGALILKASVMTGMSSQSLTRPENGQTLEAVPVVAQSDGLINEIEITPGQWVEQGMHLLAAINPAQIRFRAEVLLADLYLLESGMPTVIAPPGGAGINLNDAADAALHIGPTAHAEDRAVVLYATPEQPPTWARPGMAGYMEINLDPEASAELAIPRSAIVQDGLELVFFRRDPADPNQVIRMIADTGRNDGRWIEILSGVRQGDEVVIDGVYQLLSASGSSIQKGGHFHADGTFHEGED